MSHWVIAGGGTGGHVTMALAIGEEVARRGDAVRFLGASRGLETRLVPEAGFELVALPAQPIAGRGLLGRARGALALAWAALRAVGELRRFRTDVVVSVGGYAAAPATAAAALLRIPIVLVEPNAIPGRTNRAVARFARHVFTAFHDAAPAFERTLGPDRVETTGAPLRRQLLAAFAEKAESRPPANADEANAAAGASAGEASACSEPQASEVNQDAPAPAPPPYAGTPASAGEASARSEPQAREVHQDAQVVKLLIAGGSQGARQLNEAMIEALPALDPARLEIFHQSGAADRERVAEAYARAGFRAQVVDFEPGLAARYRWADLGLCRAGALTVAELALAGLPALLVPYPYAADDHQRANAEELARAGAARVLDAKRFDGKLLVEALEPLLSDREALLEMGRRAAALARPAAAERIVDRTSALLEGR